MKSQPSGFLLIDKPAGITSHDVVDRLRWVTGIRRIGHSGTLDPFATGLLICGIGAATKRLGVLLKLSKTYEATMHFGATSDTGDLTGRMTVGIKSNEEGIGGNELTAAFEKFVGDIEQIPPMYSAKKMRGQKLYVLARRGETVERVPQHVTIHALELHRFEWPIAEIKVSCSSGTYIRTLVEDIGRALRVGAYTEALRRTAIGDWRVEDAVTLDLLTGEQWHQYLKGLEHTGQSSQRSV